MTQKELFEQYGEETEHIWYYLGNDEELKVRFLQFAKELGLHWMNGSEIDPEKDGCGAVMGVDREGRMGGVTLYLWSHLAMMGNRDTAKRIDFATGQWIDQDGYKEMNYVLYTK